MSSEYEEFSDDEWLMDETSAPREPTQQSMFTSTGSNGATQRLVKDLKAFVQGNGIVAEPIGDNLYEWQVKFSQFDGPLAQDLAALRTDCVELRVSFSSDYPFAPPFVRVVRPRFQFHTGHVTIGGSICMELLTRSGWLPTNDFESLLIQVRSEMLAGNARLDLSAKGPRAEYSEDEARRAFERVARDHGWN
jgi:ubiquitin-conjugating enzyme E2 Q